MVESPSGRNFSRTGRQYRGNAGVKHTDKLAPPMALALRAAAAWPGLDPGAFAFAILQTQSDRRCAAFGMTRFRRAMLAARCPE